jgi:O-antigen ligase
VALLAIYTAWARGGSAPAFFWAIPWLALGIVEMIFLLPPQRNGESMQAAVRRAARGILRDPVFYVGLTLLAFLTLQWLNGPRELIYNASTALWEYAPPPWPGLPFCVVRDEASQVLYWALGVVAILLGMRHGMRLESKRWLLRVLVYNGAILAAFGLLQMATGTDKVFWIRPIGVFFFSTFGYPNHASAYFTLLVAINIGLLIESLGHEEPREQAHGSWLLVALVLNLLGVVFAMGRAGLVLTGGILLVALVYGAIYLAGRLSAASTVRLGAAFAGLVLFGAMLVITKPDNPLLAEIRSIDLLRLHEQLQGDRAELADAALQIWGDYPWAGTGGWGFRRFVALYMGPEKYEYLKAAGRANVHNDTIQYLCEHGAIGLSLIVALVFVLVGQLWFRLVTMPRVLDSGRVHARTWFMSVSPVVWMTIIGTSATIVHSLIDLPFRSMAIISLWFIALAAAPAFVPRKRRTPSRGAHVTSET